MSYAGFDLTGRVIAVTGATGVIMSELCISLGQSGAKVALMARGMEKMQELSARIPGSTGCFACDVTDKASVSAAFDKILAEYGRIDGLVNGAGGSVAAAVTSPERTFFDIAEEGIDAALKLNYHGTVLPSQVFGAYFMERNAGSIVNISSMGALRPLSRNLGYTNAKAAVTNFTQWLAAYFPLNGAPNVRVNAIAPGFLVTAQNRTLMLQPDGSPTARGEHVLKQTPLGRFGQPTEMVGAVLFLLSDAASFVTGAVLPIDGGFSCFAI